MTQEPDLPEIEWVKNVSNIDDDEISARLRLLPVPRQADLFLSLDWKDRLKIIRNSEAARELVRSLPDEEVLLTIKGAGEQDSLQLISLATPDQLQFILDVELWSRDSISGEKARLWMKYLLACGERKVTELAKAADRELLVIMLSKLVSVIPNEEGVKIPKGLPSIMPDEYFTILSNIPEETENIRLFLRILREWDRDRFYRLLFEVHGSADVEMEEKAFRWRNSRLEDKGLLDFDEAVEIYGYVGEQEAREVLGRSAELRYAPETPRAVPPTYPVRLAETKTFFYKVLKSIDDTSLQNRLRREIAFSANRLLVADARSIGEIDSMRKALRRLFSLVNVGLLHLTGGAMGKAAGTLAHASVTEIFQIGFSRVADLRTAASEIARKWWPEWREQGFVFLDFPDEEVMRGLMFRVPQYYMGAPGGGEDFRDFETMDEVSRTRQVIDEIAVVAEACFDTLGIPRPHEAKLAREQIFSGEIEGITLRALILTGFVNFALRGEFGLSAISRADAKHMFEKVLEKGAGGGRLVRKDVVDGFISWLSDVSQLDGIHWNTLRMFVENGIRELEEEIGNVPSWKDLDPRYVRTLVFSRR